MTREEPRRWDWWLAGCGALASMLIVVDVAAVVSDDGIAATDSAPQAHATAAPSSHKAAVGIPSSGAPVAYVGRAFTGECEGTIVRGLPSGSGDPFSAGPASGVGISAIHSGPC